MLYSRHLQCICSVPIVVMIAPVATNPVWKDIMMNGLCGCFDDCGSCCMAMCFRPCLFGQTQSQIGESCFLNCFCYGLCCGVGRSRVQESLGVPDSGCFMNCCIHAFCGCCATAQESRAVRAWILSGKPAPIPGAVSM